MISNNRLDLTIEYYQAAVDDIRQNPMPGDFTQEKEDLVAALKELRRWREAREMMEQRHDGSPSCYWVTIDDVLAIVDRNDD